MKRCTSLSASALLVGLSLTTASVAFAAPPVSESAKKPVLVAQADPAPAPAPADPAPAPTDPAPAPAPAPEAAPSTAPAAPESSTPAVSIGFGTSSTPAADTSQSSSEEPKAKPAPRRWAGTSLFGQTSMTTATVFKGQQQDWNPTADAALYFLPRYTINEAFQLRGRLIFSYEYTNSDTTVTNHEPRFGDTTVSLFYRKIPSFADIKPQVALNVTAPTSPESRARTMIVTPGLSFQLARPFEHFLGGDLLLLASGSYTHPFYESQTPEVRGSRSVPQACFGGGTSCADQLSGVFNASDTISYSLLASATWGKWSPALYYLGANQWAYTSGANVPSAAGIEPTSFRQSHYFSAWLDYEFNGWLTAEVGYFMSRSALAADGKYGNPFFDRYQDTRVYLGANITVDNLIQEITGKGAGEAGIVRAKNSHNPISTF